MMDDKKQTGLDLMRQKFPDNLIGKLAKGSKQQTQCDVKEKKPCNICGGFHHPKMIHLDYVGHAALTDRLLDADPVWFWEPLSFDEKGLPLFDDQGGLWIKLTVCGHTRLGYGNAEKSQYKEVGSREKEVIGDALRNAAMRFGAALELWHKGDLHIDEPEQKTADKKTETIVVLPEEKERKYFDDLLSWVDAFNTCTDTQTFINAWNKGVEPHLANYPEKYRNELLIAKKEVLTTLGEKK